MTTTRLLAWAAALALVSPHVAKAASGTVSAIPSVPVAHPQLSGTMDHSARKLPRDLQHQLDQIPLLDREVGAPPVAGSTAPAPRRHQRRARAATVASSWVGASDANWTPSDTNAAFGPAYVLQAVNSRVVGYSRSGAVQSLNESLCTFLNVTSSDCFDPRVIYDYESGRFIATAIVTYSSTSSAIVYMYSTSLTPTHANWCRYQHQLRHLRRLRHARRCRRGDGDRLQRISFDQRKRLSSPAPTSSASSSRRRAPPAARRRLSSASPRAPTSWTATGTRRSRRTRPTPQTPARRATSWPAA
jgi:hypothetical protein